MARPVDVTAPHVAWGGDVPDIWTEDGGRYTSVLLALYARQGVGWAMREPLETPWVRGALEMALGRGQPEAGLMHQGARGSQSARQVYRALRADRGSVCSMRGQGACLDKAVAERFFGRVKHARTATRYDRPRQAARAAIIDEIEMFYNSWRTHSSLGDVSPNAYAKIVQAA